MRQMNAEQLSLLSRELTSRPQGLRKGKVWISPASLGGRRVRLTARARCSIARGQEHYDLWYGYEPESVLFAEFVSGDRRCPAKITVRRHPAGHWTADYSGGTDYPYRTLWMRYSSAEPRPYVPLTHSLGAAATR